MYAQLHARRCDDSGSQFSAEKRSVFLFKENIHIMRGTSRTDYMGAVQYAVTEWWSEVANLGIRPDMLYSRNVQRRKDIKHFIKMAWWNNVLLGCAIEKCPDFYFTSCIYGGGGNVVDANIYEVGSTVQWLRAYL
ncbi:hypothetical protein NECAME_06017 [Necator americanus]|uniref:SCP domain-containing protein n=1 Tax=Necator americanus TaxID=51031 RepID=W2TW69_NECAM|nr:hypothetical protein NECAME_06017 [Necator americanus]ETN86310.1 hypothetical protein NECAME_06017 [Necator americanus]